MSTFVLLTTKTKEASHEKAVDVRPVEKPRKHFKDLLPGLHRPRRPHGRLSPGGRGLIPSRDSLQAKKRPFGHLTGLPPPTADAVTEVTMTLPVGATRQRILVRRRTEKITPTQKKASPCPPGGRIAGVPLPAPGPSTGAGRSTARGVGRPSACGCRP